MARKLEAHELRPMCDPKTLPFSTTLELEPLKVPIIGQEKAQEALDFGLKTSEKGYNIFVSGSAGEWRLNYILDAIRRYSLKSCRELKDWCYVHNFSDSNSPIAVQLPAGLGKVFKDLMDQFIKSVATNLLEEFKKPSYQEQKNKISDEQEKAQEEAYNEFINFAKTVDVKVFSTGEGNLYLRPSRIKSLKEQYEPDEIESKNIEIAGREYDKYSILAKSFEIKLEKELADLDRTISLNAVESYLVSLRKTFSEHQVVIQFLDSVVNDILTNLDEFLKGKEENSGSLIIFGVQKKDNSRLNNYRVNLFVDNSKSELCPIIQSVNPVYSKMVGRIDIKYEMGYVTTDHTFIRPGELHLANDGYFVVNVLDLLESPGSWQALKRVIRTQKIEIQNINEEYGVGYSSIKPQSIPVSNLKIILMGNSYLYHVLYEYDEDFKDLFKIKVDFEDTISRSKENINELSRFIASYCSKNSCLPLDSTGAAAIVDYASRLAEHQERLTSNLDDIETILAESATWARISGASAISKEFVEKAISERLSRSNKNYLNYMKELKNETFIIDTVGSAVGEINGLSVVDYSDFRFGFPAKITAITSVGQNGIVSIDREVKMSGPIHAKGVSILTGYIQNKYAQDKPLALSASICFEQNYGGVEGDSASSTELYCLLSSLTELPIKQGIAVTGSVNQKGKIQVIGGVTEKIEGFEFLCELKGLTGEQGVIIPDKNVKDLCLSSRVIDAVENGLFSIYTVETIEEGIEILTGVKAGVKLSNGRYPKGTVNYLVEQKLKAFAQISKTGSLKTPSSFKKLAHTITSKIAALSK